MDDFLTLVESFPHFQLGQADLDRECSPEAIVALRQHGVLVHRGKHVRSLPCGIHQHFGACSRWLRYSSSQNEYIAICQSRASSCPRQIESQYKDLKAWEFDPLAFAGYLKLLLGLREPLERKEWLDQPLWYLGCRDLDDTKEDVYLLLQPHRVGFAMLLAQLSNTFADCWVLVPTWAHIPHSIRSQYSVHTAITVCALTDLLTFDQRNLVLDRVLRKAQHRLFAKTPSASPPFCILYRHGTDPHMLSETEYASFQNKVHDFNLFIDLQKPKFDGLHGVRVLRNGQFEDVFLSTPEITALAFLMRSRAPLPLRQIPSLQNLSSPDQLILRARRKIDDRIRQKEWTYFQTISQHGKRDICYQFAPAPGIRWALIVPYKMIADDIALTLDSTLRNPQHRLSAVTSSPPER